MIVCQRAEQGNIEQFPTLLVQVDPKWDQNPAKPYWCSNKISCKQAQDSQKCMECSLSLWLWYSPVACSSPHLIISSTIPLIPSIMVQISCTLGVKIRSEKASSSVVQDLKSTWLIQAVETSKQWQTNFPVVCRPASLQSFPFSDQTCKLVSLLLLLGLLQTFAPVHLF